MSHNNQNNNWKKWIEDAISKKYIKHYEYKYFKNIQEIGTGNFGKVYRANWKNSEQCLALKSFFNLDNITIKELVNEVHIKIYFVFLKYVFIIILAEIFFYIFYLDLQREVAFHS